MERLVAASCAASTRRSSSDEPARRLSYKQAQARAANPHNFFFIMATSRPINATALISAANRGREADVAALLADGADVNEQTSDGGWTALLLACARVHVVGIKGRPELNGQTGTIGEFNEAKGRFPVHLEGGESVLIKMMNLVAIGDDV